MKKTSILLGIGLGVVALALTTSTRVYAQRGPAQLGDTATVVVPADQIKTFNDVLVVTGPAKAPKAVGNCGDRGSIITDPSLLGAAKIPTRVAFYDADVVPRTQVNNVWVMGKPYGKTEVAIIWPGFMGFQELKTGYVLGSGRDGGKCGPGYQVIVEHIVGGAPGGVNRGIEVSQKQ